MLGGGLQLALIPAPLVAAAIVVFALTPRQALAARIIAGIGLALTIALLAVEAAFLNGTGGIETSLGTPVSGITYLLRLDLPGSTLGLAAAAAGLLLVVAGDRQTREVSALLVCVAGAIVAALAGNMVMLAGGVEIAGVGTLLMTSAARGRPGRGGLVALGIDHLASLGLVVAAVQLLSVAGTTDFAVIPAGALGPTVAGPWAAAGVMRLLSPAFVPVRGTRTPTAAWATTGAIPCGAIVLLRLREVAAGPLPEGITIALAAVGGLAAVAATMVALRRSDVPVVAGRALCVVAAAPVIALAGVAGGSADTAVAAGICAVMLVTALTPAWEHIASGGSGRALAAFSLAAAGSLPVGFGITALILELSAAVSIGRPGSALLAALGVAGILGAAAAVLAAARVLVSGVESSATAPPRSPSLLAGVAALVSLVMALIPGTVATSVLVALNSSGVTEPIGVAAIRSDAGDWAGGYIVVAFVIVAAGVWALATLAGWSLVMPPQSQDGAALRAAPIGGLGAARRLRPAAVRGNTWLRETDNWLVVQPQLVVVLVVLILGILLSQLIH
jgi:formate hydrogenlyase subunit 3/multisubunit Na+/H+ antiporter MnhD subunit